MLRKLREMPLLEMIDGLYRHQMEKFYNRKEESTKWVSPLVPVAMERFNQELTYARMMTVYPADANTGVVIGTSGRQCVIELRTAQGFAGSCSCKFF
jgi:hypothetical protein